MQTAGNVDTLFAVMDSEGLEAKLLGTPVEGASSVA